MWGFSDLVFLNVFWGLNHHSGPLDIEAPLSPQSCVLYYLISEFRKYANIHYFETLSTWVCEWVITSNLFHLLCPNFLCIIEFSLLRQCFWTFSRSSPSLSPGFDPWPQEQVTFRLELRLLCPPPTVQRKLRKLASVILLQMQVDQYWDSFASFL